HDRLVLAGRYPADRMVTYTQPDVAAADQVLRQVVYDQLRPGSCHRPGPGIPVWNELVAILPLCRRHLRRSISYRGTPRVFYGINIPGTVDLRLGPHTREVARGMYVDCTHRHCAVRLFHPGCELVHAKSGGLLHQLPN